MTNASPATLETLLAHAGWLRSLARGLVVGEDRADDVVQETWLSALEHPPRHDRNLRSWLGVVARNAARQLRRRETRAVRRERAAARSGERPDTAEAFARVELRRRIAAAVLELEEPYRSAVVLRYFEEMTPRDIARSLDVPASTVRNRISRALATLRRRLDREHGGDRRAWCVVLLPLCLPGPAAAVSSALWGGLVMSAKLKLGIAAVFLLLLSAAVWRIAGGPDAPPRPEPGPPPPDVATARLPAGPEPPREEPSDEIPSVVMDTGRIAGRVLYEDGEPARGVSVSCVFAERFPVADRVLAALTGDDGAFAFPAVRGAPYRLVLNPRGHGRRKRRAPVAREVRGGDEDVRLTIPRYPRIVVAASDRTTGEPVKAKCFLLDWVKDGRPRYDHGISGGGAIVPLPPPGAGPGWDRDFPTGQRLAIELPPSTDVDPGTAVRIRVVADGYESAALSVDRSELRADLLAREVALRPLPRVGWELCIRARRTSGTPFEGRAEVVLYRDDDRVQARLVPITDGTGTARKLVLEPDRVVITLGACETELADPPAADGRAREVEIEVPDPLGLRVDPQFEGDPRSLWIRVETEDGGRPLHFQASRWPTTLESDKLRPGKVTVTLGDEKGEVVSTRSEVAPDETVMVRPFVPRRR